MYSQLHNILQEFGLYDVIDLSRAVVAFVVQLWDSAVM